MEVISLCLCWDVLRAHFAALAALVFSTLSHILTMPHKFSVRLDQVRLLANKSQGYYYCP